MREASSGARSWDRDKEQQEEDTELGRSREWKVGHTLSHFILLQVQIYQIYIFTIYPR